MSSYNCCSGVHFTLRYPRDVTVDISEGLSDYEETVWDETAFNVCPGIEKEATRTQWTQSLTGTVDGHFILDWHPASQQVQGKLQNGVLSVVIVRLLLLLLMGN